jgi:hypothetical protein
LDLFLDARERFKVTMVTVERFMEDLSGSTEGLKQEIFTEHFSFP